MPNVYVQVPPNTVQGIDVLSTGVAVGLLLKAVGDGTCAWGTVAGTGDVVGGSTSVNGQLVAYSGTSGKSITNSAPIVCTPTVMNFSSGMFKVTDTITEVHVETGNVFQFITNGHERIYIADNFPQFTVTGADIWLEPISGGGQGSIGALNVGVSDIGYVERQIGALPGFHPFRYVALTDTLFFNAPTEAHTVTTSSAITQFNYTGTIAANTRTLFLKYVDLFKINGPDSSHFIENYFGHSGVFKTQTNLDSWLIDCKFVSYSSTAAKARTGTATLSSGSVTIANDLISTSDVIFCNYNTISGTPGNLEARVGDISAGVSFKLRSTSASDNSTVNWWIINKQ